MAACALMNVLLSPPKMVDMNGHPAPVTIATKVPIDSRT